MAIVIGLFCIPVGFGIFWVLKQFVQPLTDRIPTSRRYWPGLHHHQERKR